MRAKFLYLIYLLSASGTLTAQDAGLRPVEIRALKDRLLLATYFDADPRLMPLARKLSGTEDRYPGWQAVMNELAH